MDLQDDVQILQQAKERWMITTDITRDFYEDSKFFYKSFRNLKKGYLVLIKNDDYSYIGEIIEVDKKYNEILINILKADKTIHKIKDYDCYDIYVNMKYTGISKKKITDIYKIINKKELIRFRKGSFTLSQ